MTLLPHHYPGLVLAARPGLVPPRLDVVRNSAATRINPMGLVEEVPAQTLRDDYDRDTGEYLGWLIETQGLNRLLHGRDMGAAAWIRTNLAATKDRAGADGVTGSGCRLAATAADATVLQTLALTAAARVFSIDLMPLTVTGAVSLTVDGGATWVPVTSFLRAGRFTRVTLTASAANPVVGLRLSAAGDAVVADFGQLEDGAVATSRIATADAPVARAPDRLTLRDLSDFWNPGEGTLIIHCRPLSGTTLPTSESRQTLLSVGDSSADLDALLELARQPDQGDRLGWGFGTPVGYGAGAISGVSWQAPYHRVAIAWTAAEKDPSVAMNGGVERPTLTGTGTINPIPAAEGVALAIGHQRRENAGRDFRGHVGLVLHYPRRLPDADLTEATS